MKRYLFGLLVIVVGSLAALAQAGYTPVFEPGDCPFPPVDRVTCGTLTVPETRADPDAGSIELAVAIIAAADNTAGNLPVIYLEGGPGGAPLLAVEEFVEHPLAATRDLILFDQRGTGFSQPNLNCWEMEEGEEDGLAQCYTRLQDEGINLSAYNSVESAADVNDLRLTLGYDQVNLWGISYGTRLGLSVLRYYPDTVRAAVLDSVFPPEIDPVAQAPLDALGAFEAFFNACAADATCAEAYPDLEANFYALVERFNENPPVFLYFDGEEEYELELYGDDLLEATFQTLYNSEAIPMLPYGMQLLDFAADDFDYTDGYDILLGYYTPESWAGVEDEAEMLESVMESGQVMDYLDEVGDISDSEGMYASVTCAEETAFSDLDAAYDAADALPDALYNWVLDSVDVSVADCDTWQVTPAAEVEAARVQSSVPTLLISGGLDPVTPPSYGNSALEGLSNGFHIVFPVGGHSESGGPGCAAGLAVDFFDNPTTEPAADCVPQAASWYTEAP